MGNGTDERKPKEGEVLGNDERCGKLKEKGRKIERAIEIYMKQGKKYKSVEFDIIFYLNNSTDEGQIKEANEYEKMKIKEN